MTSTTIHSTSELSTENTTATGRYGRAALVAGVAAAAANTVVAVVGRAADVSFAVKGEKIPLFAFPQATLMATVVGFALAWALTRRAHRPRRTFVVTTVTLTALSMPPAIADTDTATKLVLALTHLVAAVILIPAVSARLAD
jgi:Family of unknown function (DUF6069)